MDKLQFFKEFGLSENHFESCESYQTNQCRVQLRCGKVIHPLNLKKKQDCVKHTSKRIATRSWETEKYFLKSFIFNVVYLSYKEPQFRRTIEKITSSQNETP